ncbi:MAG: DHCW motif cupin fold protein [Candidatus Aminicenantes bacterium]|nr:DHCW motif cupin fold protein [Candidatus Aminicenantes bacterium]
MAIANVPFTLTDWTGLPRVEHKGETGTSTWKTVDAGGVRVRVVEYSPRYKADHWCGRGHILLVLDGELEIIVQGGGAHILKPGTGFVAGDDPTRPHLVLSSKGARVYIVD